MKRIIATILIILAATGSIHSQNFYVQSGGAFNLASKKQILATDYSVHYSSALDYVIEDRTIKRSSISGGGMGSLSIGYVTENSLLLDLTVSRVFGRPVTSTYEVRYSNGDQTEKDRLQSGYLLFTPSIGIIKPIWCFDLYLSEGLSFGFISADHTFDFKLDLDSEPTQKANLESSFTGKPTVGIATKFGLVKKITPKLSLFGEVGFTYMNFSPDKNEVTKYSENGVSKLNNLTTSEKLSEYEEQVIVKYGYVNGEWIEVWDEDSPRKLEKFDIPASFTSIGIGVRFSFQNLHKGSSAPVSNE